MWQARIDTVRTDGIEAIADAVMARYFHDSFRNAHAATVARFRRRLVSTDVTGYLACCAAVAQVDTTARLGQVQAPTLVIAGALDAGTPLAMAETLAAAIPHAQLLVIDGASHLSAIEQPDAFAAAITTFAHAN
jgi:3-oxoadipate enol-lactonase